MTHSGEGTPSLHVPLNGQALLNEPLLNKDTAFTLEERAALGLEGLLPASVSTMEQQVRRAHESIARKSDPLERYIGLLALQDRNEHLYYRLLIENIEEFLPIVYTPTVGLACQQYSHIYRRRRGIWISPEYKGRIRQVLDNSTSDEVRLIVVTDNERILGLGDLGAGGIGIPIGKLALYTAAAGIHPSQTLPISLDVGTDNKDLLKDDLYVGWPHPRLRGEAYFELVEEFVTAVRGRFPHALLQWEDFKKQTAFELLDRYADTLPSFNDDIQGTAAVAVAAMLSAVRLTRSSIARQRVVIVGGGAAGIGIARQLKSLFERNGLTGDDLLRSVAVLDSEGFVHSGRTLRESTKREVAWPVELAQGLDLGATTPPAGLEAVVRALKPTVLIGVSGMAGIFTESIVRLMAATTDHPVILPLSNPTSNSEALPADLVAWTDGRAIIASGSPFEPVPWKGRTIRIGQANNIYIFPGVGLGVLAARATNVTDAMFTVAAEALAHEVSEAHLAEGMLFPPLSGLRRSTARVAEAVVREAVRAGLAPPLASGTEADLIRASMWEPVYPRYLPGT
jgi:malate dehydrogenase (oxaloacetate-decarboxylating)